MTSLERLQWLEMSAYYASEVSLRVRTAAGWERAAVRLREQSLDYTRRWLLSTLAYRTIVEVT